jgi:hypothetical protein
MSAPQKRPTRSSHLLSPLGTWRLCERQVLKGKVMERSKAGHNVECQAKWSTPRTRMPDGNPSRCQWTKQMEGSRPGYQHQMPNKTAAGLRKVSTEAVEGDDKTKHVKNIPDKDMLTV